MSTPIDSHHPQDDESPRAIMAYRRAPGAALDVRVEPEDAYDDRGAGGPGAAVSISALLRYKWTILGVFLLSTVPAVAAVWLLMVPQYRAIGHLRVEPRVRTMVFKTEDSGLIPRYPQFQQTQAKLMRRDALLQRVLDRSDVQKTEWYRQPDATLLGGPRSVLSRLREALHVDADSRSELIDVYMETRRPQDAAVIVNAVLLEFRADVKLHEETTELEMFNRLEARKQRLETEDVDLLRTQIQQIQGELIAPSADSLLTQQRNRLDELEAQRADFDREIKWIQARLKALETTSVPDEELDAVPASMPADDSWVQRDAEWRTRQRALRNAESLLESQLSRWGEGHYSIRELRRQAEVARAAFEEYEAQLKKQGSRFLPVDPAALETADNPEALQRRLGTLPAKRGILDEDIQVLENALRANLAKRQELVTKQDELDSKRRLYQSIQQSIDQRDIEKNAPDSISTHLAVVPSEPSDDKRIKWSAMALFAGLMAGMSVALLRVRLNQRIREPSELLRAVHAPLLGQLPLVSGCDAASLEASPIYSECIRMVRTALLQRTNERGGTTVLVTSAGAGSGKSTVASMLAKSLAQCGKKVLLVDADLRNPALSKRYGVESQAGLIAVLSGQLPDSGVIFSSDTAGLDVLPAGRCQNGDDQELLANGAFSGCLRRWRDNHDIVLLDSSPILPVADARILARHVDGIVIVVREDRCRRDEVADALSFLGSNAAKVLGAVFVGSSQNNAYRRAYEGYYYHATSTHGAGPSDSSSS